MSLRCSWGSDTYPGFGGCKELPVLFQPELLLHLSEGASEDIIITQCASDSATKLSHQPWYEVPARLSICPRGWSRQTETISGSCSRLRATIFTSSCAFHEPSVTSRWSGEGSRRRPRAVGRRHDSYRALQTESIWMTLNSQPLTPPPLPTLPLVTSKKQGTSF